MRNGLITTLIVLLLLIAGGAGIYVTDTFDARSEFESRTVRAGIQVLEGEVQNRTLKEFNFFGEKAIALPLTGRLIDYAPAGYAITFNTETGLWNVEVLATQKTLTSSTSSKLWLSTSPNGHYLVFAERTPLEVDNTLKEATAVYDPAQWTVHLVDTATEVMRTEATGSMPRFFEREGSTHLLYLRPDEVRVRVIGTQREFALPYAIDGLWPVEVSPDGKYLALFNMDRMSYEIFTFALTDGAIVLTPLPSMPVQVRILAFKGSDLYASAWLPEEERAELVVIDLKHPESVTILSDRSGLEHVRRIIPAP
jgi:hypothetical protein